MKPRGRRAGLLACWLCLSLLSCRSFEIRDLTKHPLEGSLEAKNKLPIRVGIHHLRDQRVLSPDESSVEVTLYFAEALRKSKLFDTVIYPDSGASGADVLLWIDFERFFDLHRKSNLTKNLLLLASGFVLYPWVKIRVDYGIRVKLEVERDGEHLKTYKYQALSSAILYFFSPVDSTADELSRRTMQAVSEGLMRKLLKDEPFFLSLLVQTAAPS